MSPTISSTAAVDQEAPAVPAGEDNPSLGTAHAPSRHRGNFRRYAIWIALLVLVAIMCGISPSFRTTTNLTNILEQNSMLGIVACGMLVMMVSGLVVAQRSRAGFEGVGPVVSRDLTGDQAPSGRRGNGPL